MIPIKTVLLPLAVLTASTPEGYAEGLKQHFTVKTVLTVSTSEGLRKVLQKPIAPDTTIKLRPGTYEGGFTLEKARGKQGRPIVVMADDPANPPLLTGGGSGLHLIDPFYVELRNLNISGCLENGVNADDGGTFRPESRGLVLEGLRISKIGPKGNHDGLKLSGITGFQFVDCTVEDWGTGSGSGVDMVGCHDGLVTGCSFRHQPGTEATGGNGVQMKGGSSAITVRKCRFVHAGLRAVNIGGSTGIPFFRPPLDTLPSDIQRREAADITVEGCTITGSQAAFAFVGVDSAVARFNTIIEPGKWLARILQETRDPRFVPCRNGLLSDNLILFRRESWSENGINIGSGTAPEAFRFRRNHWYCLDAPAHSRPRLPSPEEDGVYGVDPQLEAATGKDSLRTKPGSPAAGKGAEALPEGPP